MPSSRCRTEVPYFLVPMLSERFIYAENLLIKNKYWLADTRENRQDRIINLMLYFISAVDSLLKCKIKNQGCILIFQSTITIIAILITSHSSIRLIGLLRSPAISGKFSPRIVFLGKRIEVLVLVF